MSNVDALDETLTVLRELGRIEPVDAARVGALRTMAEALDGASKRNSQMYREYRESLEALTGGGDGDGEFDKAIEKLHSEIRNKASS